MMLRLLFPSTIGDAGNIWQSQRQIFNRWHLAPKRSWSTLRFDPVVATLPLHTSPRSLAAQGILPVLVVFRAR